MCLLVLQQDRQLLLRTLLKTTTVCHWISLYRRSSCTTQKVVHILIITHRFSVLALSTTLGMEILLQALRNPFKYRLALSYGTRTPKEVIRDR
ncbi:VP3 [Chicken proventriculitis-associated circular virus 28]|nr:VP3 [Chicken proventriculitis-associated circular virus 28]